VSVLDQLAPRARVAVLRLRSLGDCVLTTPALRLLKQHRPDLRIGVAVEDRFADVFAGNPDVYVLLECDRTAARRYAPELCLNLHGGSRSMWMTACSGARFRAGFAHHTASFIYTHRLPRAQQVLGEERTVHTAEHLASAVFALGAPRTEIPRACVFPSSGETPATPYAVLHPFAATAEKTWPAAHFLSLAAWLQQSGLQPIFLAGPQDDASAFSAWPVQQGQGIRQTATLLVQSSLFIGNDSGPAHIAAAVGAPVLVFFGPSQPAVWSPWRTRSRVLHAPQGIATISIPEAQQAITALRSAA
jgi:heptosyltransferase III